MSSKEKIHRLLRECSDELLAYIKDREGLHADRWVPAAALKEELDLNFVAVPRDGIQHGKKGWMFAILARMLEDEGRVEYRFAGNRAFYRATQPSSESPGRIGERQSTAMVRRETTSTSDPTGALTGDSLSAFGQLE